MVSALVSALLTGACFPSTFFSAAAFVSLVPLFRSIEKAGTSRQVFLRGFTFGAFFGCVIAYWIFIAVRYQYEGPLWAGVFFLVVLTCLPLGILFGLFALGYRYLCSERPLFFFIVIPALWIVCEYIRELVPLYLPWGFMGYTMAGFPRFIQIADVAGVYGLSFIVVFVNSQVHYITRSFSWGDINRSIAENKFISLLRETAAAAPWSLIAVAVAVSIPLLYGSLQLSSWKAFLEQELRGPRRMNVRIVQGNFTHRQRWEQGNLFQVLDTCLTLTGDQREQSADTLILWPETVLNMPRSMKNQVLARIAGAAGERGILVFGGTRSSRGRGTYNAAYFVTGRGSVTWYDKVILLPFAETAPFGISMLGAVYDAPSSFGPGKNSSHVRTPAGDFGISICFEKIFSWFVRDSVRRGAGVLINISNDAWFGRSTEPYQHRDIAVLRAVENRRYMVVAANSGISAIISPTGEITGATEIFTRTALMGTIVPLRKKSLYTGSGDWVLFGALAALCGVIIVRIYRTEP